MHFSLFSQTTQSWTTRDRSQFRAPRGRSSQRGRSPRARGRSRTVRAWSSASEPSALGSSQPGFFPRLLAQIASWFRWPFQSQQASQMPTTTPSPPQSPPPATLCLSGIGHASRPRSSHPNADNSASRPWTNSTLVRPSTPPLAMGDGSTVVSPAPSSDSEDFDLSELPQGQLSPPPYRHQRLGNNLVRLLGRPCDPRDLMDIRLPTHRTDFPLLPPTPGPLVQPDANGRRPISMLPPHLPGLPQAEQEGQQNEDTREVADHEAPEVQLEQVQQRRRLDEAIDSANHVPHRQSRGPIFVPIDNRRHAMVIDVDYGDGRGLRLAEYMRFPEDFGPVYTGGRNTPSAPLIPPLDTPDFELDSEPPFTTELVLESPLSMAAQPGGDDLFLANLMGRLNRMECGEPDSHPHAVAGRSETPKLLDQPNGESMAEVEVGTEEQRI